MVSLKIELGKRNITWMVLLFVVLVVGVVYAYGTSDPAVMGHSAGEIEGLDNYATKEYVDASFASIPSGSWPAGSYCIFANGACPSGFVKSSGYMRAISLFAGTSSYIKQATFGSSNIKCHGACGQYGNWIGELNLEICCK